jgi:hypothetical protein
MKINVVIANTRKESSRIANAGVDTGANMLGVGAPPVAAAISWFPILRGKGCACAQPAVWRDRAGRRSCWLNISARTR